MLKYSLSEDDAIKRIEELKSKTSGTLENFIRRHGSEEGPKKFKIFSEKSSHTKEKYKIRYGEDWEVKWDEYRNSKAWGKKELIAKYGEEEGLKKFEERSKKRKASATKEALILKFGQDGYDKIIESKKSGTLKNLILKYGEEIGNLKYKELNFAKSQSSTKSGYIKRFGEGEGIKRYNKRRISISPIFQQLKKKYGEIEALEIYQNYQDKRLIVENHGLNKICINKKKASRFSKMSCGCVSKESDSFFKELSDFLNRPLIYGSKKEEHQLFDEANMKKYYFDCFDPLTNTLIEFHGVAYHPKIGDTDWISAFGRTYEDAINYDTNKKNFALNSGYKYLVVYSDETKLKHKRVEKILEISKILNNEN